MRQVEILGGPNNGEIREVNDVTTHIYIDIDGRVELMPIRKRRSAYFYKKNGYTEYYVTHPEREYR